MNLTWHAQVKAWPVPDVAARLGMPVERHGLDVSFPCPVCGKARRHEKGSDKRLAAKVVHDGGGWWCEPCGATGDAVALAAALAVGSTKPKTAGDWAKAHRACSDAGLCEADASNPGARAAVKYAPPAKPVQAAEEAPRRPPADELEALWAASSRLDAVPVWDDGGVWCGEARRFLAGRGFDVATLASLDLARVLPPMARHSWPSWWPSSWSATWRLAVPLYAPGGDMVSVQARAVGDATRKTNNPPGCQVRGAFFADAGGLEVLRGEWSGPLLVVVEGLTDFLAAAQLASKLEAVRRPAVLGIVAGSAAALSSVALASACRLNVLTDNDETGERYFRSVGEALPGLSGFRVRLRAIDGKRADLSDWLKHSAASALAVLTYGVSQ